MSDLGSVADTIRKLQAENERLREALEKIVERDWYWAGDTPKHKEPGSYAKIARTALAKEAGK